MSSNEFCLDDIIDTSLNNHNIETQYIVRNESEKAINNKTKNNKTKSNKKQKGMRNRRGRNNSLMVEINN